MKEHAMWQLLNYTFVFSLFFSCSSSWNGDWYHSVWFWCWFSSSFTWASSRSLFAGQGQPTAVVISRPRVHQGQKGHRGGAEVGCDGWLTSPGRATVTHQQERSVWSGNGEFPKPGGYSESLAWRSLASCQSLCTWMWSLARSNSNTRELLDLLLFQCSLLY